MALVKMRILVVEDEPRLLRSLVKALREEGYAVTMLGRDMTFTDRTFVWADLLARNTNPLVGVAYDSFWLVGDPPHGQYPPVFPALLALTTASEPGRAPLGVAVNLMLSTAALGLFALLCWRWSPPAAVGALAGGTDRKLPARAVIKNLDTLFNGPQHAVFTCFVAGLQ